VSCTRRDLLRGFAAGTACAALGCRGNTAEPIDAAGGDAGPCTSLLCISLATETAAPLRATGGAQTFALPSGDDIVIVIRTGATTAVALSDICTHQGCGVTYQSAANRLFCPCHGSEFSLTGSVLQGPAIAPLKVYTATLDENAMTIDVS